MQIQQLSIFVENKSGRLAEITRVLADADVDLRAVSIADTSDFGILRLIVDKPLEAVAALKAAKMTVSLTNVIAIGIEDKPGSFADAMAVLAQNGIGVEYMYAYISRDKGQANVILRVDNDKKAAECLSAAGVTILEAQDLK